MYFLTYGSNYLNQETRKKTTTIMKHPALITASLVIVLFAGVRVQAQYGHEQCHWDCNVDAWNYDYTDYDCDEICYPYDPLPIQIYPYTPEKTSRSSRVNFISSHLALPQNKPAIVSSTKGVLPLQTNPSQATLQRTTNSSSNKRRRNAKLSIRLNSRNNQNYASHNPLARQPALALFDTCTGRNTGRN